MTITPPKQTIKFYGQQVLWVIEFSHLAVILIWLAYKKFFLTKNWKRHPIEIYKARKSTYKIFFLEKGFKRTSHKLFNSE